ncbi:MAG: hypothetical protein ACXWCV_01910 [Caldimonas sp.]
MSAVVPPLDAAARLATSRGRLRAALMEIAHPAPRPSLLADLGLGNFKEQILDRLKALPGAALVLESLEHWWAEHPLHAAGVIAEEAARRLITPLAQKNPYAVVIGAGVVGALFALSRPWRWLIRPALFVGLVPQLASQALKRMPIESWLQMASSLAAAMARPASAAPTPGPEPAPDLPRTP